MHHVPRTALTLTSVLAMAVAPGALSAQSGGAAVDAETARQVERIHTATAAFKEFDAAVVAGYSANGGGCVANPPEGVMGYHHVNQSLLDDRLEVDLPSRVRQDADRYPVMNALAHGLFRRFAFDLRSAPLPSQTIGKQFFGPPRLSPHLGIRLGWPTHRIHLDPKVPTHGQWRPRPAVQRRSGGRPGRSRSDPEVSHGAGRARTHHHGAAPRRDRDPRG
jgi:hypothetical protein